MRSNSEVVLLTVASTLLIGAAASTTPTVPRAKTYTVELTGHAEASVAQSGTTGDEDGSGSVRLALDPAGKQVCYDFRVSNLATPLMAHIHKAPAPRNGPSVVTLFTGPGGALTDCVVWTEARLAEIVANPSNFYVNLYTTEYPDGAIRGQLAS